MKEILLGAIVCPNCHGKLEFDAKHQQLICPTDRLIYPIKDGIPLLLTNEALPLVTETFMSETIVVETVCQTVDNDTNIECDETILVNSISQTISQKDKG